MVQYQHNAIYGKSDLIAVADHAGSFFFSPRAMRAFNSRISETVWAIDSRKTAPGNRYLFITSEKYGDDAPRHYAVRMMTLGSVRDDRPSVDIDTVGEHHATMAQAKKAAQALHDAIRYQGI